MKSVAGVGLQDVQGVYGGPEGELWELLMGEQIHIGGFQSSMDLAERAGIGEGQQGVDFCCASGAGMRFLVRFRKVARMKGVDVTRTMLDLGRKRCVEEGLADRGECLSEPPCSPLLAGFADRNKAARKADAARRDFTNVGDARATARSRRNIRSWSRIRPALTMVTPCRFR